MSDQPPAILLMGPTAAGKTGLALALCDVLPCEIVSVDSAMVYRGMDIGTAKPDRATLARYPHRLVDIREPEQSYSAGAFRRDALAAIAEIQAAGAIPLLVGGTMLYFRALLEGLAELPAADSELRAELAADAKRRGWPALHAELAAVDPDTAARLHPNHSQRIARALEVYRLTGTPLSELQGRQHREALPFRPVQIALAPAGRAVLHQRIAQRVDEMLQQGLVEEVRTLRRHPGLDRTAPALRAVGYRQVWQYLEGELDEPAMKAALLAATRQLAKRQLTWLRRWPDLHWLFTDAGGRLAAPEADPSANREPVLDLLLKTLRAEGITKRNGI